MSPRNWSQQMEKIKAELDKPIPKHHLLRSKSMTDADNKTPSTRRKATKKKATASKGKATTTAKSKEPVEQTTLADLADEIGISTAQCRQKLRAAEIEKPDGGRWAWKPNSRELKAARKALSA